MQDLEAYLAEIREIPFLPVKEEERLAKRVSEGDKDADRTKLAKHNLRLVIQVVERYKKKYQTNTPLVDLVRAGNEGLFLAIDNFDSKKRYKFSVYAIWWIRAAIAKEMAKEQHAKDWKEYFDL